MTPEALGPEPMVINIINKVNCDGACIWFIVLLDYDIKLNYRKFLLHT